MLHDLRGWARDAARGRLQSVSVGVLLDRTLWRWSIERCKGELTITLGFFFVDFGG